eukprot:CAMPEP_0174840396 /NCGR_PEP_ID=MMETSP1114-20130205/8655_1 /TAXON_ID=312471 /ORGANISM="Neobodo designis, Strain CCAP 1951/1" /LENGTH=297 /DNA_ID=CAMNT_0016074543 /DNA_START=107 /DNA_END=1000 /DNA_ORIENTATION=-
MGAACSSDPGADGDTRKSGRRGGKPRKGAGRGGQGKRAHARAAGGLASTSAASLTHDQVSPVGPAGTSGTSAPDESSRFTRLASQDRSRPSGDGDCTNPLLSDSLNVGASPGASGSASGPQRTSGASNARRKPRVARSKRQPMRSIASPHAKGAPPDGSGSTAPPSLQHSRSASEGPRGADDDLDGDIAKLSSSAQRTSFTCHLPGSELGTVEAELTDEDTIDTGRRSAVSDMDTDGSSSHADVCASPTKLRPSGPSFTAEGSIASGPPSLQHTSAAAAEEDQNISLSRSTIADSSP